MRALANIEALVDRVLLRFAPPPDVTGSEWANEYRRLSPEASAEVGRFRIERTPYMREILDVMTGSAIDVEEVWFKKSAQIAYSETLNNALGYYVHLDPGPIMMVQPTLEMAESYSKDRIEPMLRDTEALCQLTDFRAKQSSNTILRKKFPGGLLQLIGANSPAAIASRPIRIVFCDEVDRYPHSTGKEGDPIELARARQATYESNRMFVAGGTPVLKGASRTAKGYESTDQRKYFVQCPHCKEHIALEWDHFEKDDPKAEHYGEYKCQSCEQHIEHHHKISMLADQAMGGTAGWSPTNPDAPANARGYFIWTAYSPFRSWRWLCDQWQKSKGDPELEQVFFNTVLGLEYAFSNIETDCESLHKQREDYRPDAIPDDILVITCGVDCQDDRFELEVVGWGDGEESWSLDFQTIDGDPASKETLEALDDFLKSTFYTRVDGREMGIKACFIDSGGHRTDAVYSFVRGKQSRHIYPCKGVSSAGQPIFARWSKLKKAKVRLAHVGTDTAKETIYSNLSRPKERAGRMHFPMKYSLEYFRQLTSEEKVIRWTGGQPRVIFQKKKESGTGGRNEPLDCRVYALSALRSLPINLRTLARKRLAMKKRSEETKSSDETPEKSPDTPENQPKTPKKVPIRRPRRPKRAGWLSAR
jgi:phage terminase large subunit GpA-like protein